MSVATFTKAGTKATTPAKLNKDVFGLKVESQDLLKQAYLTYLANGRENHAVVKRRGEVRGGGKKPWRQKGTGRARFGSSRNPIWRGGGIAFGPTGDENYTKRLSVTMKHNALKQALSLNNDKVKVIDSFECKDGKVQSAVKLFEKIDATNNVLLVVEAKDALVIRATNNIPYVTTVSAKYLNVFDVLNADSIVLTKSALDVVHEWLGGKK